MKTTVLKCAFIALGAASLAATANAQDILVDYNPGTGTDGGVWWNECCDHYYAEDVTFDEDTNVNGIDIYTTHAPSAGGDYMISIWEDDGFGTPGALLQQWEQAGSTVGVEEHNGITFYRHEADFADIAVPANTTYWFGMTSVAGWHLGQSSLLPGPDDSQMAWFQLDAFFAFTTVGDMSFRLRGSAGPGDCIALAVSTLVAGSRATWDVSGATPGQQVAVVYGFKPGSTVLNGFADYCASFGINGVNQKRLICQKTADGAGNASCSKTIPGNVAGTRVLSQAAQRGTCPDECVSNIDDQTIK